MILAFDIGNTNVAAGVFTPGRWPLLAAHWKLRRPPRARSGWWKELAALVCAEAGITPRELDGCAVCSVVPGATRVLAGGTCAWEAAGRALERGATRLADEADDVVPKPYERGRAAMEAYLAWEEALDYEGVSPVRLIPEAR